MKETVSHSFFGFFLRCYAVVFGEDVDEGHLRDDVSFEGVLEKRGCGQVEGEDEELCDFRLYGGVFEPQTIACVGARRDFLLFDF